MDRPFTRCSVTRLGDFRQFCVTNFRTKVAQIFGDIMGDFQSKHRYGWLCLVERL